MAEPEAGPVVYDDVFDREYRARLLTGVSGAPDAEVLVQETLLAARRAGPFPSYDDMFYWCRDVIRRMAWEQARETYRLRETSHPEPELFDSRVVDPEARAILRADLDRTLRRLSAEHVRLLMLRAAGWKSAEIAALLGVEHAAARKRVSRAAAAARAVYGSLLGYLTGGALWRKLSSWRPGNKMRPRMADKAWPLTTTQFVTLGASVLSMTALLGVAPVGPRPPTAEAIELPHGSGAMFGPPVPSAPPTTDPVQVSTATEESHGLVSVQLRTPPVPEDETCSPPTPVGSACAGTGDPEPGDTLYLKRLGKEGPHFTQPVVKMCHNVPDNDELGCDSEEPKNGYQAELPPLPGRHPDESKESG